MNEAVLTRDAPVALPLAGITARADPTLVTGRHASLALILALGCFCTMDATIVPSLITPIKASLHLTDENFGRISAVFMVFGLLAAPLFGLLAGRFGRKPVLIGAVVVWSLASSGGALSAGLGSLLIWRAVTGFGESAYQGLAPGWLADLYQRRARNFVFSLFMLRNKIGMAMALAFGGWLAQRYDWRIAFIGTGLPGLILALLLMFVREPAVGASDGARTAPKRPTLREQAAVLRIGPFVTHIVALCFFYSGTTTAQFWLPAYLHRVYGLTNFAASGFLSVVLLATSPAGLIGGYLVGRYLSDRRGGLAVALAVSSLLAATAFAAAFLTRDLALCKVLAVAAIICFGATAGTLTTLVVDTVPAALRSIAGSVGTVATLGVSGGIAPWVVGSLSDHFGLDHAIFLGPAAYAISGLIWAGAYLHATKGTHR
jgi:predicted MFS family arabinose efflux permease